MSTSTIEPRPPFPPFDEAAAWAEVLGAAAAWNTRDPERAALASTPDSVWRNRDIFSRVARRSWTAVDAARVVAAPLFETPLLGAQ